MEPVVLEGARMLLAQGGAGWVIAVLVGAACVVLHRDWRRSLEARIAEAGANAAVIERASQASLAVATALEGRTRVLEDLVRLASEIARSVETNDERAREKLDDILRRIEASRRECRP